MSRPTLTDLLDAWRTFVRGTPYPEPPPFDGPPVTVGPMHEDSRLVQPGDCFIARHRRTGSGATYSDGHPYIAAALAAGAVLVVAERSAETLAVTVPPGVAYWHVPDSALVQCWLAAAVHGFPAQGMQVFGVTGTDGKTSVTNMLYEILVAAGHQTGMISTIKAVIGHYEEPTGLHVTTPQAPEVQAYLRRMADDGVTHCVLEATSMGLAEHRVDSALFDVAVVSNITHEHLDYHGDYANYLAAKARLFHLARRAAVINRDDESFAALLAIPIPRRVVYSIDRPDDADVSAGNIRYSAAATTFDLALGRGERAEIRPITTPLVGKFNIYNMLAAAGAAYAVGIDADTIATGLAALHSISGRMERIHRGQPFHVIVDFAHTPNALAKAIDAARGMCAGRIIAVFGSAGRRDVAKRRMMAEVAADAADLAVLTAEDPRGERLDDILDMMADGCRSRGGVEGVTFWRVPDRGRAIYHALTLARPDDLVLVCGKGHEQSMNFDGFEYPWDDRDATRAALDAFLANRPMPDLGLPTY